MTLKAKNRKRKKRRRKKKKGIHQYFQHVRVPNICAIKYCPCTVWKLLTMFASMKSLSVPFLVSQQKVLLFYPVTRKYKYDAINPNSCGLRALLLYDVTKFFSKWVQIKMWALDSRVVFFARNCWYSKSTTFHSWSYT